MVGSNGFLDCLASHACDPAAFLLDPRFDGVFSPAERALGDVLGDLQLQLRRLPREVRSSEAWRRVQTLLSGLGDPQAR